MADKTTDLIDKHVGSRVRMRRLMLDMSQEELGDALGITYQQVQKYENGINRIGAGRLQHLADILKVTLSFFFEDAPIATVKDDHLPEPRYITDFLILADGHALAKAFMRINDQKVRRRLVSLVEEIARQFE
jgi:transcriptional regulator with XRE-family HTH domain